MHEGAGLTSFCLIYYKKVLEIVLNPLKNECSYVKIL